MASKSSKTKKSTQRKLTAILCADVVGYSRLMGADEEATIETLTAYRKVFTSQIKKHRGRVVDAKGDAILAEFASVVDAVNGAVEIQRKLAEQNTSLSDDRRMDFRIGINLGDVIVKDDVIYGDGVNVAARLESLTEPGGICISRPVYDQVESKLNLECEYLGEQQVKNIAKPVRAYRVLTKPGDAAHRVVRANSKEPSRESSEKPSIAVMPFTNISGDPEQEYFADGMVEEIITALSRLNWLFVIARNSTFTYKGRAVKVREVARELGVRYVLEGSVRKGGNRLRIAGQLIDADSGTQMWADRFDGELEDILDLQDKVTDSVIGAIEPKIMKAEIDRSRRKRPENLDAYDLYLRALPHLYKFRPEDNLAALSLLEESIALDPHFAPALANAAWCYEQRVMRRWPTFQEKDIENAGRLARSVMALNTEDANALALSAFTLLITSRDFDVSLKAAERALSIHPNSASVCWTAGWVKLFCGYPEDALTVFNRSRLLSPFDTLLPYLLNGIAGSNLILGNFTEAAEAGRESVGIIDEIDVVYWFLSAACAYSGLAEEAQRAVTKLVELNPLSSISHFRETLPFKNPDHLEIVLEGFRRAGLRE